MTEAPRAEPVRRSQFKSLGARIAATWAPRAPPKRTGRKRWRLGTRIGSRLPPRLFDRWDPPLSPSNRLFLRVLACWTRFRAKAPL